MVKFLAGLAVGFTLIELGVRWIAPGFPEQLRYYNEDAQVRVEQMEEFAEQGQQFEVVFVGSSVVRSGVDPELFSELDHQNRSAYDAGMSAATPYAVRRFLLEEVIPRVDPRLVVYGINSSDVAQSPNRDAVNGAYRDAPATRPGWIARAAQRLFGDLAVYRYRAELSRPGTLKDSVLRRLDGAPGPAHPQTERARGTLAPDGSDLRYRQRRFRVADPTRLARYHSEILPAPWRFDPAQASEIRVLENELAARGIELVVVDVPVARHWVDHHAGGMEDYRQYKRDLRAVTRRANADFIDAAPGAFWDEQWFANANHLNGAGTERFTQFLADTLADSADSQP